jgi:signal transduction histidine kinase
LKKDIYILILFSFLVFNCKKSKTAYKPESSISDSLTIYIRKSEDENRKDIERIKYCKEAFNIIEQKNNDRLLREQLFKITYQFYKLKLDVDFKNALKVLMQKSIDQNDSLHIAKSYNLKGNLYIDLGINDSAYYFLLKSEKLFLRNKDSLNLAQNYIDKAFVQLYENDYSGCELSSFQSLVYSNQKNSKVLEYQAYNLIGISSNEMKNYENALSYHKKALNIANRHKLIKSYNYKASSLNNIGVVFQNLNNHKEAVKNFDIALSDRFLLESNPYLFSMITDNLAYSKFKLKDFSNLPNLFFKSLGIREKNGLSSGIIINKIHLSEFFAEKKDTINAQKYALEALKLAKETKVSGDLLSSLKQLSLVEHKNVGKYSKEYIKISDSLQLEERKAKDKFARIAYETDEIIEQKDKLTEQNRTLLYFFIGTLFLGILLFVIRTQRAKNRELLLKQQQQKINEEIYNLMISQQATIEENRVKEKKRIAQELHDGVLGRLFGARLNLDSLNRFNDEDSVNSRFNYLAELKNIEQDIREISHDLNREKYVLINNFVAIVSNLLEEQSNSFEADLVSSLDESIQWDKVSNAVKINLYRILQESLQNINKYANAKHIAVELKKEDEHILLKITDDGIGFDVNTKKKGIGLQNMQSRVDECEGKFDIKSKKGKGTTTIVSVPIEKKVVEA